MDRDKAHKEKEQMLDSNTAITITSTNKPAGVHEPIFESSTKLDKLKKILRNRLEILNWIGDYNTNWGINDCIAGITLGLTIIPESIACALLAGLPPHYGLCSAFLGCFIYLFFGSIHNVIVGPTSLVALVSLQFTVGKPVELAILLTFMTGVVELIMGSMRLGIIFEFLSMPVIKAFSSATAVLVIESQLKVVLGIKYLVSGLVGSVATLISRLDEANMGDLVMGVCAIVFLIVFAQLENLARNPKMNKGLSITFRYLSFSRNTLIVLITATVSYIWMGEKHSVPYALSKNALSGLPNVTLPAFSVETPERTYTFWNMLAELNVAIIVIPIVGILTNISIGKLCPMGIVDSNKELVTIGLCNVFGSFVQSMPVSGAFSRYAISSACGLRTPMVNLYSGTIVLLALSFLSPYFNYIPESTLAAILMCSIVTLLDLKLPRRLWRDSKRDFIVWVVCFSSCVLCGVEVGLAVSVLVTAMHLLFMWARPEIIVRIEELNDIQYIRVTPAAAIYFPAINYLRAKVLKICTRTDFKLPIVIDCHKMSGLDYTAAQGITKLTIDLYQPETGSGPLVIVHRLSHNLQNLIDLTNNLCFCESEEKLDEYLTQDGLRSGSVNLKEYISASRELNSCKLNFEN